MSWGHLYHSGCGPSKDGQPVQERSELLYSCSSACRWLHICNDVSSSSICVVCSCSAFTIYAEPCAFHIWYSTILNAPLLARTHLDTDMVPFQRSFTPVSSPCLSKSSCSLCQWQAPHQGHRTAVRWGAGHAEAGQAEAFRDEQHQFCKGVHVHCSWGSWVLEALHGVLGTQALPVLGAWPAQQARGVLQERLQERSQGRGRPCLQCCAPMTGCPCAGAPAALTAAFADEAYPTEAAGALSGGAQAAPRMLGGHVGAPSRRGWCIHSSSVSSSSSSAQTTGKSNSQFMYKRTSFTEPDWLRIGLCLEGKGPTHCIYSSL